MLKIRVILVFPVAEKTYFAAQKLTITTYENTVFAYLLQEL